MTFTPTSQEVTLSGAGVTGVNFSAAVFNANLTVDGSLMYQTIDGMGVNIDVGSWKNGEVKPALDLLINTNGSSLFRVVRDPMTWVIDEALIPLLHALDRYPPIALAVSENTLFAWLPTRRMVPTTITRITASITAYSAMSWP